jgi:hypothetical protein
MRKSGEKVKRSNQKKLSVGQKAPAKKPARAAKSKASRLKLIKQAHAARIAARLASHSAPLPLSETTLRPHAS